MSKNAIIFFVKYPSAGNVKTRLAKDIGDKNAAGLYRCFVLDILNKLKDIEGVNLKIFVGSEKNLGKFKSWLGSFYEYRVQAGDDLGERMAQSFSQIFEEGYSKAVIIGSDMPEITSGSLLRAFSLLDENDAVIGPSRDGGYYLLGFNKRHFVPEVFKGIRWSSDKVYMKTLKKFSDFKKSVYELRFECDIDNVNDLEALKKRIREKENEFSHTVGYLKTGS